MHKCPKCGSQNIKGQGWADYAFDPDLGDFYVTDHEAVSVISCNDCGHELSEDEEAIFWGKA